jgi:uncharacterized protein (TIGR03435 family)
MEQFAARLQNIAPGVNSPVSDETELDGTWDFTLTFSMQAMMRNMGMMPARLGSGDGASSSGGAPGAPVEAAAPVAGLTVFEALEKELGLKLDKRKRTAPVIVIDHLEQKPTEN